MLNNKFILIVLSRSESFCCRRFRVWVWIWVYWCFTSHATIFQSHIWRHRCAGGLKKKLYLRSGSPMGVSRGSLTCPSYTDMGPPFLYGDSDTSPHLVAFYDTLGIRRTYSRLKPPASSRGIKGLGGVFVSSLCFFIFCWSVRGFCHTTESDLFVSL